MLKLLVSVDFWLLSWRVYVFGFCLSSKHIRQPRVLSTSKFQPVGAKKNPWFICWCSSSVIHTPLCYYLFCKLRAKGQGQLWPPVLPHTASHMTLMRNKGVSVPAWKACVKRPWDRLSPVPEGEFWSRWKEPGRNLTWSRKSISQL